MKKWFTFSSNSMCPHRLRCKQGYKGLYSRAPQNGLPAYLRDVMEGPLTVLKMSGDDAREHAAQLLDKVGVSDKLDVKPGELSGGQQQRVAIARALAIEPKEMLFGEVTSARA